MLMGYPVGPHSEEAELTSEFAVSWGCQSEALAQSHTEAWFQASQHQHQQLSLQI